MGTIQPGVKYYNQQLISNVIWQAEIFTSYLNERSRFNLAQAQVAADVYFGEKIEDYTVLKDQYHFILRTGLSQGQLGEGASLSGMLIQAGFKKIYLSHTWFMNAEIGFSCNYNEQLKLIPVKDYPLLLLHISFLYR